MRLSLATVSSRPVSLVRRPSPRPSMQRQGSVIVRAGDKIDEIEGYKVNEKGGILESEAFAIFLKVGFVALCVGAVVSLLDLASPVISNTVDSFPKPSAPTVVTEELFN